MSKIRFKLNRKGVGELLKSKRMQKVLTAHAKSVRQRAGVGFEQDVHVGRNRANAMVWTETHEARKRNAEENTLLKSLR